MSPKFNDEEQKGINRRQFVRDLSFSCIGASIASDNIDSFSLNSANRETRQMKYRVLGRTGLKISEVSLGGHYDGMGWREKGSDKQSRRNEVISEAIKNGINYFDSNDVYESETLGPALSAAKAEREKIFLSVDTNAYKDEDNYTNRSKMLDEIFKEVDEHLDAMNTPYADVFRLTTVSMPFHKEGIRNGVDAYNILKKEGKARFFAIANHNPKDLFQMIKEIPEVDVLYIPYSYITQKAEKVFPEAKKKNIGVVCIKPFVKGGLFKLKDIDLSKIDSTMAGLEKESAQKPEILELNFKKALAYANLKFILSWPRKLYQH